MKINLIPSNHVQENSSAAERHHRHELNNYFSAIAGSLEMVAMGQIDDRSRRMLQNAQSGLKDLQQFLNITIQTGDGKMPGDLPSLDTTQITILIVEDNQEVRELTAEVLKDAGYKVVTANHSEDALNKLSAPIDLLFTDIIMPGNINGVSLMKRVQTKYPNIKILMTTGTPENMHFYDRDYITTGNIDVIYKPFMPSDLLKKIEMTLCTDNTSVH